MKHKSAKLAVTAALCVCAVIAAARCAESFRNVRQEAAPVSVDGARAEFVVRDWKGYVSVFRPDDRREPLQITGIETGSLRSSDQALLEGGLTVGSREQLLMLLEDLGT